MFQNKHIPFLIRNLSFTDHQIIVHNGDRYTWEKVEIVIDDEFRYRTDYVPRGSSSFSFDQFLNREGQAFEPGWWGVRDVQIEANLSKDRHGSFHW